MEIKLEGLSPVGKLRGEPESEFGVPGGRKPEGDEVRREINLNTE